MVVVTAVFFIPEQAGSMWPSVIWSSITAVAYLAVFSLVWLKRIHSVTKRRVMAGTLVVLVVCSAASAGLSYENSSRQRALLPEIRTHIETNIAGNYIRKPLLETLRAYRTGGVTQEKRNLGDLFLTEYDSLITEEGVFTYGTGSDERTLTLYLAEAQPERVVLIGESSYVDGEDPNYLNFSGETGRYQVEGILTPEGVYYERTN